MILILFCIAICQNLRKYWTALLKLLERADISYTNQKIVFSLNVFTIVKSKSLNFDNNNVIDTQKSIKLFAKKWLKNLYYNINNVNYSNLNVMDSRTIFTKRRQRKTLRVE